MPSSVVKLHVPEFWIDDPLEPLGPPPAPACPGSESCCSPDRASFPDSVKRHSARDRERHRGAGAATATALMLVLLRRSRCRCPRRRGSRCLPRPAARWGSSCRESRSSRLPRCSSGSPWRRRRPLARTPSPRGGARSTFACAQEMVHASRPRNPPGLARQSSLWLDGKASHTRAPRSSVASSCGDPSRPIIRLPAGRAQARGLKISSILAESGCPQGAPSLSFGPLPFGPPASLPHARRRGGASHPEGAGAPFGPGRRAAARS